MDSGLKAFLSGFIAFVVATTTVITFDDERDSINAMTIGGLTGGAVALSVWLSANRRTTQILLATRELS